MARVILSLDEVEQGRLPRVCMKCGAPADAERGKLFSWHPGWLIVLILVGLVVYVIVALVMTKRRRVWTPLCRRHSHYWSMRNWYILGGFAAIMFALIAWITAGSDGGANTDWWPTAGLVLAGVFLVWLMSAAVLQTMSIRPEKITATKIGLLAVHPQFKAALERQRDEQWEADIHRRGSDRYPEPMPRRESWED
jgi:drug/metabolite transporter (DMT)-like permease